MKHLTTLPFISSSLISSIFSVRLPFPVEIPDGEFELKVEGNLIDWLRSNGVKEHDPNITTADGPTGRFGLHLELPFLTRYGCWCYRGTHYPGGRGYPRDDFDQACKDHHMGYDCIVADSHTEESSCHQDSDGNWVDCCQPEITDYTWFVVPNMNSPGDYTLECGDDLEDDWCRANTCMVDLRFMTEYWGLTAQGVAPDFASFNHHNHETNPSTFDTGVCPYPIDYVLHGNQGGGGGGNGHRELPEWDEKVCCGDYPFRFWFLTMSDGSSDRECCEYEDVSLVNEYGFNFNVGAMFHNLRQQCCIDGVGSIGSCP